MDAWNGRSWLITAAAVLLVAGCARTEFGGEGTITVDGSSTVFPITQAVAEEFNAADPDVAISVGISGTGGGFEKFCRGETDISNASRVIDPEEEVPRCEEHGIEFVELRVAMDGLSVVTNPENDFADCLTTRELERIWRPGSEIDSWRQIRPSFPDERVVLYGPGTDSGTFEFFTEIISGEAGASRSDYTASEDDNVLVQGVAGDPNALGYFGYGYVEQNQELLKPLGVDDGSGCVLPTRSTIEEGTYEPLARPLFIYVNARGAARAEVRHFVDFYLEVVDDLLPSVGYVAMDPGELREEVEEWRAFATST